MLTPGGLGGSCWLVLVPVEGLALLVCRFRVYAMNNIHSAYPQFSLFCRVEYVGHVVSRTLDERRSTDVQAVDLYYIV